MISQIINEKLNALPTGTIAVGIHISYTAVRELLPIGSEIHDWYYNGIPVIPETLLSEDDCIIEYAMVKERKNDNT